MPIAAITAYRPAAPLFGAKALVDRTRHVSTADADAMVAAGEHLASALSADQMDDSIRADHNDDGRGRRDFQILQGSNPLVSLNLRPAGSQVKARLISALPEAKLGQLGKSFIV